MGWTREQAMAYLIECGRFDERTAPRVVDRIAALPGRRTSYDSGAREPFALRREAEAALGPRFDLRRFHDALLDHGAIPLAMLRERMQRWMAEERARAGGRRRGSGTPRRGAPRGTLGARAPARFPGP